MTDEQKQLLLNDLCGRLPYGVIVNNPNPAGGAWDEVTNIETFTKTVTLLYNGRIFSIDDVKPYLRPMESMTEDEKDAYFDYICEAQTDLERDAMLIDWLNEHHFDYRGLIPMGLALEAPEGIYKTE